MGTPSERISERKEKIERLNARIAADQEKVTKLEREIEELESLEVKGILKEYSVTLEEFRALMAAQKQNKTLGIDEQVGA